MSYLEYFTKNVVNDSKATLEFLVSPSIRTENTNDRVFLESKAIELETVSGLCFSMCPDDEVEMRVKELLVHVLEVVNGRKRLVKCYSRSAADSNMVKPKLLRPFNVLVHTVKYLLFEVIKRSDVPLCVVYDFIDDRLRAVRQDMTIQRLSEPECMILLEPMVRFYVYYGYRLCLHPIKEYDPVLNMKSLLECLKWFLRCCDTSNSVEEVTKLVGTMTFLTVSTNEQLKCDRALMESLYILCNVENIQPLFRYLNLPKKMKCNEILLLAYNIALANMQQNYIKATKLSVKLCPLSFFAFQLCLPSIRRKSIQIMSHAYNSRQLSVPVAVLREWLQYSSDSEVVEDCSSCGLRIQANGVVFCKNEYKTALLPPRKCLSSNKHRDDLLDRIFTYVTED